MTKRAAAIAALSLAWAAAPASAADQTVATVARTTTIDAYGGHAVWSTYDPAAKTYRLTEFFQGKMRTLNVPPAKEPFDADLGPGRSGAVTAVFSRCKKRFTGCDLYSLRLSANRMVKLRRANTAANEVWPAIWHGRIAFSRHNRPYWMNLRRGPAHPLRHGSVGDDVAWPEALDMRGRKVTFVWQREFGSALQVVEPGRPARTLVSIPGSGAGDRDYFAQGPAFSGGFVYWALTADEAFGTEIRRVRLSSHRQQRATTRIDNPDGVATEGYAKDSHSSWYVHKAADKLFEIHRVTALKWEKAPPIELH